ncbi:MAG TPA: thioredoxin family protein [Opitutaceae bacterium]
MKRKLFVAAPLALAIALSPLASIAGANKEKTEKPERISQGQEVQITDYVVKGKTTIFDFTSEFCPPCRVIAPKLDKLHADRADIVVVKVDINRPDVRGIDWKSPVARQYALNSIPHFKVFGPDGKLKVEGDEAYELVNGMVGG